ncbi:MAG: P-loop NTPase [Clostridia bacterium]|nr:P-loop NTPase [Clostridia bacterium]
MKNILATVSGKGGVGKSTCALGISIALCRKGKRVLLIDLDCGLRCLDIMTDVSEDLVFDLGDVLGGRPLSDAVLPVRRCEGLYLLAAPQSTDDIDGKALSELLLSAKFDYIILDLPAGMDFPFISDIADITDFLVITCGDAVSVRDSSFAADYAARFGANCRLIINKYTTRYLKGGVYGGIDDIIDRSGCRLLGLVPYDDECVGNPMGIFKTGNKKANAFSRIADRIYGYDTPLPKVKRIEKGK